jgi:hypothetical protein
MAVIVHTTEAVKLTFTTVGETIGLPHHKRAKATNTCAICTYCALLYIPQKNEPPTLSII